jgi:hypothetical protein
MCIALAVRTPPLAFPPTATAEWRKEPIDTRPQPSIEQVSRADRRSHYRLTAER